MDSLYIWRLGIHSLTVYRVGFGDDLRDVALVKSRASDAGADRLGHEGRATSPFLLSCEAESEPFLLRRPRTISLPRSERCTREKARQGAHAQ